MDDSQFPIPNFQKLGISTTSTREPQSLIANWHIALDKVIAPSIGATGTEADDICTSYSDY
jgi:hypothetical protein